MNPYLSHILTLLVGIFIGIIGNYGGAWLTEKSKQKDLRKKKIKRFNQIKKQMPDLLSEMTSDLKKQDRKHCREFILSPSYNEANYNSRQPMFFYYENKHPFLYSKLKILENEGYVKYIPDSRSRKFYFIEDFVELLLKK